MAITRLKKQTVVEQVKELLPQSKLTLVVRYQGTSVNQLEKLRQQLTQSQVIAKVVKNRLFTQALNDLKFLNKADNLPLEGMLLYVFNTQDEVSGAQIIKTLNKNLKTSFKFVAGITKDGEVLSVDQVKILADLPSQPQLVALNIQILQTPIRQTQSILNSGLSQLMSALKNNQSS